ncbi:MAG TPA: outer membrane beta-barrel protein [Steroidobacteraceae bacterium]
MSRRKGICLPALVAVTATAAATPVLAGNGLYVGATAGSSLFHEDKSDFDNAMLAAFSENGLFVTSGTSTLKKSSFAFGGLIGYQFIPQIALEASYTDLGKISYHATNVVSGQFNAFADLDGKAKGPTLSVIGALPLTPQWEVYARAGIFFSKVTLDATVSLSASAHAGTASQSANSVDPLAGVGLAWKPTKQFKIRAEYTRFSNVGDKDKTGEINIDTFNVGVTYAFQ